MKRVTIQASPVVVEIERLPADETCSVDQLYVQVFRGNEFVLSQELGRTESLKVHTLTTGEQVQVSALIAIEWLSWPDTTAKELPPSKTILELYEDLAKLVNAQKGAAA